MVIDMDKPFKNFGIRLMLPLEQNPVVVMQHLLRNFTRPVAVVPDPYLSTRATAKACLMKPQHFKFTGFESDEACVEKLMPSLLETFVRHLTGDSDIVEIADGESAARLYLQN